MTTTKQSFTNKTRKDKFILVISPPKALEGLANDLGLRDLQISVYGAPVPGISVPEQTVEWKGQQYRVSSQYQEPFDPIEIDFTIDNDFRNYWFLWNWLDIQNKFADTGMDPHFNETSDVTRRARVAPPEFSKDNVSEVEYTDIINKVQGISVYPDYQVDLTLYGLDEYNKKRIKWTFTQAFITDLGGISYNYRDADEAESTATFAFSQMKTELVGIC